MDEHYPRVHRFQLKRSRQTQLETGVLKKGGDYRIKFRLGRED